MNLLRNAIDKSIENECALASVQVLARSLLNHIRRISNRISTAFVLNRLPARSSHVVITARKGRDYRFA